MDKKAKDIRTKNTKGKEPSKDKIIKSCICNPLETPHDIGFPAICYHPIKLELMNDDENRTNLRNKLESIVIKYKFKPTLSRKDLNYRQQVICEKYSFWLEFILNNSRLIEVISLFLTLDHKYEVTNMFLESLDHHISTALPSYESIKKQEITPRREKKYLQALINSVEHVNVWLSHLRGLLNYSDNVKDNLDKIQNGNFQKILEASIAYYENSIIEYPDQKEELQELLNNCIESKNKAPDSDFKICQNKLNEIYGGCRYFEGESIHYLNRLITLCDQRLSQLPLDSGGPEKTNIYSLPKYLIGVLTNLFEFYTGKKPTTTDSRDINTTNFVAFVLELNQEIFEKSNMCSLGTEDTIKYYIKKIVPAIKKYSYGVTS